MGRTIGGSMLALAIAGGMTLAGCSATSSTPQTPDLTMPETRPSASSPVGLTATTAPAETAPANAITVEMSSFMFDPSEITAPPGTVTFFLQNVGAGNDPTALQRHNLAIGLDRDHVLASSDYISAGKAAIFTVDGLEPGAYMVWCTVPHHAENGMVGTLIVGP
jgi:plastocyanin